jgi:hypothetical protein
MPSETTFRCWSVADQRIECALSVLDQISSSARQGFRSFRHGGMEVGGILIGSYASDGTRVLEARPVEISYGRGAVFLLTESDHESLNALVRKTDREVASKGLQVVGYFESRTRRDAQLKQSDLETYDAHFYQPSQICIVVKADKDSETVTSVYIRNRSGDVLEAALDGDIEYAEAESILAPQPPETPMVAPPFVARPEEFVSIAQPLRRRRLRWMYAIPLVAIGAVGAILWRPHTPPPNGGTPPASSNAVSQPANLPQAPAVPAGKNDISAAAAGKPALKQTAKSKRAKHARRRATRARKQSR